MENIIKMLDEVKTKLANKDLFNEAMELKNFIERLKGNKIDNIRMRNNKGQINIANDNSSINVRQSIKNNEEFKC